MRFTGDGEQFAADTAKAGLGKTLFNAIAQGVKSTDGLFGIQNSIHALSSKKNVKRKNSSIADQVSAWMRNLQKASTSGVVGIR
jgi:hypothetical protein